MGMSNFCGFKTAYLLEMEEFPSLIDLLVDDDDLFFREIEAKDLPRGWTFTGYEISGASGFVITFDLVSIPKAASMRKLIRVLGELEAKYAKIAEDNATLFNADTFAEWSVYDLTDEMIEEGIKLWYWGGMMGDYRAISEKLEIDSRPVGSGENWVNPMKEAG